MLLLAPAPPALDRVLEQLAGALPGRAEGRRAWLGHLRAAEQKALEKDLPFLNSDAVPIHPLRLAREINDFLTEDSIFTPLRFNNLEVKNRIFRSSVSGRFDNEDGSLTQTRINWECKFAVGGVGAIISSYVPVLMEGRTMPGYATVHRDDFVALPAPVILRFLAAGMHHGQRCDRAAAFFAGHCAFASRELIGDRVDPVDHRVGGTECRSQNAR